MRRLLVTLVLFMEPLHAAFETLRVVPTIGYRGIGAATELVVHGVVALFCAAAGMAFLNEAPRAGHLMTAAVVLEVGRTIQSVYWSSLPDDTRPGDEIYVALAAIAIGALTIVVGGRRRKAD